MGNVQCSEDDYYSWGFFLFRGAVKYVAKSVRRDEHILCRIPQASGGTDKNSIQLLIEMPLAAFNFKYFARVFVTVLFHIILMQFKHCKM